MRFEIIVPDSTKPELQAKISSLVKRLSANPELIADLDPQNDEAIQAMFTPERLAHIDSSLAEAAAGNYYTGDQVREHFEKKESAWIKDHAG